MPSPRQLTFGLLTLVATLVGSGEPVIVDRAQADAMIKPLIDGGWASAIVIGIVSDHGRQVIGYGQAGDGPLPDGQTVFEMGSITKTFTALLLQQMAERHDVALDDPVQKFLPEEVTLPARGGKQITLLDLVTHTSGLPRMPDNMKPADLANPYADYSVQQMYTFLSGYTLPRDIGAQFEYSNLGMGLLGHVLARRAGCTYDELVTRRICKPLGMAQTRIALDGPMRRHLASAHDADGQPVSNWDIPTFAGAGALRTTVDDMLIYVAAQAGIAPSPLYPAMKATQAPRSPIDSSQQVDVAMAWHVLKRNGYVWHNGQTGGYQTIAVFSPETKTGVVVLANQCCRYVDKVGFLFMGLATGTKPPDLHVPQPVKIDTAALDACAGAYNFGGISFAAVKRQDDHLTIQLVGQGPVRFYPASKGRFFARAVDAEVTIDKDAAGAITQLTLNQDGRTRVAPEVSAAAAPRVD
jgi:CubicO group peptidase (beta-lactamase class C family)